MPKQRETASDMTNSEQIVPREQPSTMDSPEGSTEARSDQNLIARRAYAIYQERGGEHGRDLDDWLEAERESRELDRNEDG